MAFVALQTCKIQQEQLHLAHMQLHPEGLSQLVAHPQIDAHVAVPCRFRTVVFGAHPVLEALHHDVFVGDDAADAHCQVRHCLKHDASSRHIKQLGRVVPVAPKELLYRAAVPLERRPLDRLLVVLDIPPLNESVTLARSSKHPPRPLSPRAQPLLQQKVCNRGRGYKLVEARDLGVLACSARNVDSAQAPKQRIDSGAVESFGTHVARADGRRKTVGTHAVVLPAVVVVVEADHADHFLQVQNARPAIFRLAQLFPQLVISLLVVLKHLLGNSQPPDAQRDDE
mmetsp:Transcript_28191/g.65827  ORF Transcript_28191/g.65827 Transcript_28191/m.65827 type:complete len:284 (+) Transcript_28191:233-1084(+)